MVAVRAARPGDADLIVAIYAPHVTEGLASFEIDPPDAEAMRGRMTASRGLYPWLVATEGDGAVVGYAYAGRFKERPGYDWTVETSVYLAAPARGQGTGRLLYRTLIETLRTQGFVHAIGSIALPNAPSIALHEALGFRAAGVIRDVGYKFGQWIDVGIWQCALNPLPTPPVEPLRFEETGVILPSSR